MFHQSKSVHNLSALTRRCKKISALAVIFSIFITASAFPKDSPINRLQSARAQKQTIRALQLVHQGQWNLAHDAFAETHDPLASKLYYWLIFSQKGDFENYVRLTQFIRNNPEWPGIDELRRRAEEKMPENLRPEEILAWFTDYKPSTARGVDRYMFAMITTGKTIDAKSFLADWWASTTLSRDDQRMIFRKYNTYLDRAAHLRRFDTMLYRGQNVNARALAGVLGQGYPQLAEARIALRAEKKSVSHLINAVPRSLQGDAGLLYERLRWRRKNNLDMRAAEILHRPPPIEKIQNPKDWWTERHILIRRMIEKRQYRSAALLASKHIQKPGSFEYAQGEWMAGWLTLRFQDNPTQAYQHFEALYQNVQTPVSKSRGAYWAGQAAAKFTDPSISKDWYEKAARHQTTFYGQLAGAKLGQDGAFPGAAPPKLDDAELADFQRTELIQAAQLFARAGMQEQSSRFLWAFVKHEGSAKAYKYAAELAIKNGQTHEAVRISKEATKKGLFLTAQSYPVITHQLRDIDLEWALIHALIRQESMFDVKAQSPAGARGLMQLMPATAEETARKMGIAHNTVWLTSNPQHNIRLGAQYLFDMIRRYDGAYPLAIAAYNAGPGRVDQWLKTFGDPRTREVDWIDWIEMIPIYETRNYVQRVMESVYVYRLRLQKVQRPSEAPLHIALTQQ
ncbi:MAG TPA: lytic transglycosylase domain-containing protein [Alphaproteobacteria bacterium]|nr:lytic transglycosylase domain-containing protein [Alphaproteobacteria bacterium]USO06616.1 MAG: lytic transglycosylase domain-containing protein [Rhodospirillales bacterium]HOO80959.1 lytic transglycosylase domain-containing protein [Alphaproteobacteria bacterium]